MPYPNGNGELHFQELKRESKPMYANSDYNLDNSNSQYYGYQHGYDRGYEESNHSGNGLGSMNVDYPISNEGYNKEFENYHLESREGLFIISKHSKGKLKEPSGQHNNHHLSYECEPNKGKKRGRKRKTSS